MKKITLLIIILLIKSFQSNAQIVYTNIPDGIPAGIDFNSDGVFEFQIQPGNSKNIMYYGLGASNNIHALGSASSNWDVPNCVAAGVVVNGGNNWVGLGDCSIDGWGAGNSSLTVNVDEFLAIKFNFVGNTNVFYGWIRFSINSSGIVTYKDYAYNSNASQQILTGQTTSLSLSEINETDKILIYPNPVRNILHIDFGSVITENVSFEIYNTLGQTVKRNNLEFNLNEINVSDLNKGMYFLRLHSANQIIDKKILIE